MYTDLNYKTVKFILVLDDIFEEEKINKNNCTSF